MTTQNLPARRPTAAVVPLTPSASAAPARRKRRDIGAGILCWLLIALVVVFFAGLALSVIPAL